MLTRRLAMVAVLLVALVAGGCGGGDDDASKEERAFDTKPLSRSVAVQLEVEATGDMVVQYDQPAQLRVVTFRPSRRDLSLLSVGIEGFKPLADGSQFRFALDVAGRYDGPGTYAIAPPATGGVQSSPDLSNALLMLVQLKDPKAPLSDTNVAGALRFDRPASACTVELEDDRTSGTLTCPKLGDETGKTVNLRVHWRADDARS